MLTKLKEQQQIKSPNTYRVLHTCNSIWGKFLCAKLYLLSQMSPPPGFLQHRLEMWDKLKKEYDEWVAAQDPVAIKITLPDGKQVEGNAWRTTPYEVARGIRYFL